MFKTKVSCMHPCEFERRSSDWMELHTVRAQRNGQLTAKLFNLVTVHPNKGT